MKIKKMEKLLSYYKPYKLVFFIDLFCSLLTALISVVIPLIIKYLLDEVMLWEKSKAINISILCVIGIVFMFLILYVCNYVTTYYGHLIATKMEKDMRNEIFRHYQKLSLSFYENRKIGELMSRVVVDLENISEFLHHFPEEALIFTVRFIAVFTMFFIINPFLAFIALVFVVFIVSYISFFTPKVNKSAVKNKENTAKINAQIEDSLSGIRVVKSFANEKIEIKKFEDSNHNFVKSRKQYLKSIGILFAGMNSFVIGLIPLISTIGILMAVNGLISMSDIIVFILYIDILVGPFFSILGLFETMSNSLAGYNRFIEILEINPEVVDKKDAKNLKNVMGNISFDNVTFRYEKGNKNIFKNLNLEIKPKEYVALVGSSGVGKSTLCNLIPRFYNIQSGKILIDGQNIKDIKIKSLRKNIGMVQQDTYLFSGTIKENIAYGKPDATDEEIISAAKNAHAHEFIMNFSDGYNTDIGQRGVKLSGGQKQRISIARVFLKNPPILILDEATSALDNESEKFVQLSLEKLSSTRTTLVIAHRLSTIRKAKRILVLGSNGIIEEGNHNELLRKNGVYAEFYNMQFEKACLC